MIIGHEQQKQILEKIFDSYENGGFLLFGPEGIGKFGLIKEIAEKRATKDNLIIIRPQKKSILKDTADLLRNLALLRSCGLRVIIINEAHTLTDESQNLLLKTLEEILSKTFFFFVSNRIQKILPTIRSRLQTIKFGLVSNEEIKNLLKDKADEKEIRVICEIFSGQIGLVIRVISESPSAFNLALKFIKEKDEIKKMLLTEQIIKEMELDEFLKYLIVFERANLRKNIKKSLLMLKNLLSLYFDSVDSEFPLNKNLHIKNICVNYY